MRVAIMQPYLLPYLGYFQLINAVDKFIIYDNIQYVKKGWINRNRYLCDGKDLYFTVPLRKDSDYLDVIERVVSDGFDKAKLINKFKEAYCKAPYYQEIMPIIKCIIAYDEKNLFKYIYHSIIQVLNYLEIDTEIIISSNLDIDHSLKGKYKVIEICKNLNADMYINPIGGTELYSSNFFEEQNIALRFLKMNDVRYQQVGNEFVPALSIIDVLMFNDRLKVRRLLEEYKLIGG